MHIRKLISIVASLGLLASLCSAAVDRKDERLKPAEHKSLAKGVSDYWQAKIDRKKISESFVKFSELVEKTKKKLDKEEEILACMDDWKQVFWMATAASLSNANKVKNKVSRWPQLGKGFPGFTYVGPKKHSTKSDPFPLILIIADEGEDPEAHLDASWADPELRNGFILAVVEMKDTLSDTGGKSKEEAGEPIPVDQWGEEAGVFAVMKTLANIMRSDAFAVDFDRVYLAGTGKGFEAAAATARWFPFSFAGLVGRGELPEEKFSINISNIPTMMVGDSAGAKSFAEGTKALGQTETKVGPDSDAEIAAWLAGQVRNSYPSKINFQFPNNSTVRSYWLNASGVDANAEGGARIEAAVDRASNTINITTTQVGSIVIYYNDVLVDMDKPVKVIINGETKEEVLKRNQLLMVEAVFNGRDWGSLRTAEGTYAVTAVAKD